MEQTRKPEVLAPAGSMDSLKAAVSAGCDAIYIGGSRFGARAYADNPQKDEMIDAIHYCHLHGVKIYMTVNTLLREDELYTDLYTYLAPYYQAGLDAVIVQDMGVLRYIHACFPDLDIHASTQMTLTMGISTSLLEEYGVTRIVPARELTLAELRQMRKETGVELEVFVHGALCYCYSGQCLFSSMLGNRSGNRGRCAQPCRMQYCLQEQEGYFLSPKENCALPLLDQLIEAGVDSFKIEGRMKKPEYTAFVTAMYRKYVDLYFELGARGYAQWKKKHTQEFKEDLRLLGELYNREGFTSGYLEGESGVPFADRTGKGTMLASRRPRHGGIEVGEVLRVDRHTVTYRASQPLYPQDVVEFRDSGLLPSYEYTLGEAKQAGEMVTARYQKGCRIHVHDKVYRTRHGILLEQIHEKYIEKEAKEAVRIEFTAIENTPVQLNASIQREGRTVIVQVVGDLCQAAQKQPATQEGVRKVLCQTGDTPFVVEQCSIRLEKDLFLPVGVLKKLRRKALVDLQQKLMTQAERKSAGTQVPIEGRVSEYAGSLQSVTGQEPVIPADTLRMQEEAVREATADTGEQTMAAVLTWEQFEAASREPAVTQIALKMEEMTADQLKKAAYAGEEAGKEMFLILPAIFREGVYRQACALLEHPQNLFTMPQWTGYIVRNLESFVFLTSEAGIAPERIQPDHNLYLWNREAWSYWYQQGCRHMTLPLELTGQQWTPLAGLPGMQAVVYGCIPLMVSAQCVRYNTEGCVKKHPEYSHIRKMTDTKGRAFYVYSACRYCYNMIWQAEPLVLTQQMQQLRKQGIRSFRYDFTVETAQQTAAVLRGKCPQGHTGHYTRELL